MELRGRVLKRLLERRRAADRHQVVRGLDPRPPELELAGDRRRAGHAAVRPLFLLHDLDAELDVERRLDAGAGDVAVAVARQSVAEKQQRAGLVHRQQDPGTGGDGRGVDVAAEGPGILLSSDSLFAGATPIEPSIGRSGSS